MGLPMRSAPVKKFLGVLLQIAVTGAALGYVFHDPHKRAQMAQACRHADWHWLAAGLGVYGLVETLAVIRWQLLLRIQGFRLGWARATGILFIGEFFLTFTPGLVGGDAMRILYLLKDAPEKAVDAVTVVVMDRIMGMLALICLAATIVSTRYAWLTQSVASARLVEGVLLILGGGAAALVLAVMVAGIGVPPSWPVPQKVRELADAFRQFAKDWRGTLGAFGLTLASHVCYYTSFGCAALALGHLSHPAPTFGDVFDIMPVENTLTALPISFAGIGLREGLFQTLLHDLAGVPPAVGALIGAAGFSMKLLWSLPGAFVFLTYRLAGRTVAPATPDSHPARSASGGPSVG